MNSGSGTTVLVDLRPSAWSILARAAEMAGALVRAISRTLSSETEAVVDFWSWLGEGGSDPTRGPASLRAGASPPALVAVERNARSNASVTARPDFSRIPPPPGRLTDREEIPLKTAVASFWSAISIKPPRMLGIRGCCVRAPFVPWFGDGAFLTEGQGVGERTVG
jgi:hypothetical protein